MDLDAISRILKPPFHSFQRLLGLFKTPGDIPLFFRIGLFIWLLPRAMKKSDLPDFLRKLRDAPRPMAADPSSGVARVARLRAPWFKLRPLAARNTCYTRAITLYRYVGVSGGRLRIHFGIEPANTPGGPPRGHAWVTASGRILEPPDPVIAGRVKDIYVFPDRETF